MSTLSFTICQYPGVALSVFPTSAALQRPNSDRVQLVKGYTLVPGDRLRIYIQNLPVYSGEYQVLADGSLNLPLVGSVCVQGKALNQAVEQVSTQYGRFIKRPIIRVTLIARSAINSKHLKQVKVLGGVKRPGSYTFYPSLRDETGIEHPTVIQAIQMAGGITQSADIRHVQVRRRTSSEASQIITVNLEQLLPRKSGSVPAFIF